MEQNFYYFAFISYKRENEKWAKWLQNKLENYNLPTVIRKETPHLPRKIRPVFRDKTDLGGGHLEDNIRKELHLSQYLIVICSPISAQSVWVGKEIKAFAEIRNSKNIIPFIVSGEPNSESFEKECLNPEIKAIVPELLGISVSELGKEQAFVKVAAQLLGLRFDTLWNRHRRRFIKQSIFSAIIGFIILVGVGYYWDYGRTKYEYYADYVDCFGIPKGLIALSSDQIKKRNTYYLFEKSKNKIRSITYCNSTQKPVEHNNTELTDRPSIIELKYNEDTTVTMHYYNCRKKLILIKKRSADLEHIDFINEKNESRSLVSNDLTDIDANLFSDKSKTKSQISRYVLQRDKNGFVIAVQFMKYNDDKTPTPDFNGIFGFHYKLDNLGRILEINYVNKNGDIIIDKNGIAGKRYQYDQYGNIHKVEYLGLNRKLAFNQQSWSVCVDYSNEDGNIVVEKLYGTNGKLCLNNSGYAICKFKYDDNGHIIDTEYFDIDGYACKSNSGYSKIHLDYDKNGNNNGGMYFNEFDEPCKCNDGYKRYTCDYYGDSIKWIFYNDDWIHPALCNDGYASVTNKMNSSGEVISEKYCDTNGHPCINNKMGCSECIYKYNKYGCSEISYLGIDGKLCKNGSGISSERFSYDNSGNLTEICFLDEKMNWTDCEDGYAKESTLYDDFGHEVKKEYFSSDRKHCYCLDKYSTLTNLYQGGLLIESRFYGITGKLCLNKDGYSIYKAKYDDDGNCIEEAYFDVSGKLCMTKYLYAKLTNKFDSNNNLIEKASWNASEMLTKDEFGVSKYIQKFDNRGNLIEMSYRGSDNHICIGQYGYARGIKKYDNLNRIIEIACFGIDGLPCKGEYGYSKIMYTYNQRGDLIEEKYIGNDNKLFNNEFGYAKYLTEYDHYGNMIQESYFDENGNLWKCKDGYAKIVYNYDKLGHLLKEYNYGVNNKLCINVNGVVIYSYKYDSKGNQIEGKYFGSDGKPTPDKYGSIGWCAEYDRKGNEITSYHLGKDGNPLD